MIEEIKRTALGASILAEWLGDGGVPVSHLKAERRAMACVMGNDGKLCPHNGGLKNGVSWWNWAKDTIASTIRLSLGVKNRMKLKVASEDRLEMCKICGCALRTKIWVPIEHVRRHTTDEMRKQMPSFCWLKEEGA